MKIITNTSIFPFGGIARRVREMKRVVNETDGIELVTVELNPNENALVKDKNVTDYKLAFPETMTLKNIYKGLESIDELHNRFEPLVQGIEKILYEEKADVCFVEGTYYAPWCLFTASRRIGLPTVFLCAGILRYEIKKFPEKLQEVMTQMEEEFYNPELMFLFPSNLAKSIVEKIVHMELPYVKVIPNGIAREFFGQEPENTNNHIGFVGRVSDVKNPRYLITLSDELRKQRIDMDISMVSELKKSRFKQELMGGGIQLLPVMDTQNLRSFYRNMGIIISPSYFETFGNVPLEAIATGTHAVISNRMGVAEVFEEFNLSDYIVDFNDVSGVVSKLNQLRNHRVSKDIRESLKKYCWDSIIKEYFDVCKREKERMYSRK